MLIDEYDTNILPLAGEAVKRPLDRRDLRLVLYDKEIALRVGGLSNMLHRTLSA